MSTAAAEVRRALGPVGAFLGISSPSASLDHQREDIRRLERSGFRAIWTNEIVGADALVRASLWLAATDQLVVGTCIATMWARPAQTAHAAATQLGAAYPGRFVLGLGIGHPEQAASVGRDFGAPVATARAYLQQMGHPAYPRILGANGPRMLALAGELTDGALPAGKSPAFTAQARSSLGGDALLVVYVPLQGSDTVPAVSEVIAEHRQAGADHVIVGLSYSTDFAVAVDLLEGLAPTVATIPAQ